MEGKKASLGRGFVWSLTWNLKVNMGSSVTQHGSGGFLAYYVSFDRLKNY